VRVEMCECVGVDVWMCMHGFLGGGEEGTYV